MLTMGFITPIQADDAVEDTTVEEEYGDTEEMPLIQLFIVTDGDFITIGDDDVIGQIQDDLENLGIELYSEIYSLNKKVDDAQDTADFAKAQSHNAYLKTNSNQALIDENAKTLVVQYDQLTDTIDKLWVLRDEVVAFEAHYLNFTTNTNSKLNSHFESIELNQEELNMHNNDINTLYKKYNHLKGNWDLLLFVLFLIGAGFLGFGVYKLSKKHYAKKKTNVRSNKQPTLVNYLPQTKVNKKAKKGKAHIRVRKTGSRRSFHLKRNPERNPIRFMFSFFHKL